MRIDLLIERTLFASRWLLGPTISQIVGNGRLALGRFLWRALPHAAAASQVSNQREALHSAGADATNLANETSASSPNAQITPSITTG
jgi:hypothetical protein